MSEDEHSQVLPVALGVGVVITSFVIYKLYFSKPKTATSQVSGEQNVLEDPQSGGKKILLKDPQVKYQLPLIEKEIISHDTRKYRFGLPEKDMVLGLPIGQHIHISAKIDDQLIIRSYTPVSSDNDQGYIDLVIKVYFKNVHPKFPEGGKMTQHLESLKIGDTIDIRGPSGRLQYLGHGKFSIKKLRKDPPVIVNVAEVSLIAGGVGITPVLQILRHIMKDPTDNTKLALLFANQTEEDILLRKELEEIAEKYPDRFKFWYTLDRPKEGWKYSSGFIDQELLEKSIFPASDKTIALMCGPPPMINYACLPNLEKMGYNKELCFAY